MKTDRELLQMALDALENALPKPMLGDDDYAEKGQAFHYAVKKELREALARPEREPVADYSGMSREAIERHAARMAQALANDRPRAFWEKYAIGPKSAPSCICCGRLPEAIAIQHAELPGVVVCQQCRDAALASQTAPVAAGTPWPKARDVGRVGDMSPDAALRVGLDSDNDVYVSLHDENGGASIEFCCPGAGGGKSSRTRMALVALMVAMEADNAETPSRDWWALRMGESQAKEGKKP